MIDLPRSRYVPVNVTGGDLGHEVDEVIDSSSCRKLLLTLDAHRIAIDDVIDSIDITHHLNEAISDIMISTGTSTQSISICLITTHLGPGNPLVPMVFGRQRLLFCAVLWGRIQRR